MNVSFDLVKTGALAMLKTFCVSVALALSLPIYALADDIDEIMAIVIEYYGNEVEVSVNQPPGPESADQVRNIVLTNRSDRSLTISAQSVGGRIALADIGRFINFLSPVPSERRVEALSGLLDNSVTLSAEELSALAAELNMTMVPSGDAVNQEIGIFTRTGEQLSTLEGGDDSSISEVRDGFSDALASLAESQTSVDMDLADTVLLVSDEMESLSVAVVNAPAAVEARSRVSPALEPVSGPDSSTRLKRAVLESVVRKIDARVYDQKRFLRPTEKRIDRDEVEKAFEDAGLTDVRLDNSRSPKNPNIVDVVRDTDQGVEILASGLEMKDNGGQRYFSGDALISLRRQLNERMFSESGLEDTIGPDIRWGEWSEVVESAMRDEGTEEMRDEGTEEGTSGEDPVEGPTGEGP